MNSIKFGTDGWRAIIASDYTVENVRRVAEATAIWLKKTGGKQVVIGYDCRFGGVLFAETTASVLGAYGIKVLMSPDFSSTPMVSLGVAKTNSQLGVVITASHNPPDYNGYKLKSHFGGPLSPVQVGEVEALVPEHCSLSVFPSIEALKEAGLFEYVDLEEMYLDHVKNSFDLKGIKEANVGVAYDAMYGAGQRAMPRILPDAYCLHCDFNPSFKGQAPEPIHKNLKELSSYIASHANIQLGIATDGDADRIGLYDESGRFVDSHHILLLLLLYLGKYKGQKGNIIITFSVTDKMKNLAALLDLPIEVTPIGFKYIADIMTQKEVLVGGEESGGLAVKGHIPERDGIWIGLMILEFMSVTGKSLKELIQEVYDLVGSFWCDRDDLHITESQKQAVINHCNNKSYTQFGDFKIEEIVQMDGTKFLLGNDRWVMIRPSGTEPVLRVYAQAENEEMVRTILDATKLAIS
jgi:phosphomannomutase